MKKLLQLSILIHTAEILTTAKCLPAYLQIALVKALHNHYGFLSGTSLIQKRAESLLFYITWLLVLPSALHIALIMLLGPH